MSIKTIRKACFFTMFIGFGMLPFLSWGGDIYSEFNGHIGRVDKDGDIYNGSNSRIGHVEPGDVVGALYLLKGEF